jgi:hypothetical protein
VSDDLTARLDKLRKHSCSSCDLDDEERAYIYGWNAALTAAGPALTAERQAREQAERERDHLQVLIDAAVEGYGPSAPWRLEAVESTERAEQAEQERDRLQLVLRYLMKESVAVIALAEPQLRDTVGHTNFSAFRLRVEEAAAALSPQDGQP